MVGTTRQDVCFLGSNYRRTALEPIIYLECLEFYNRVLDVMHSLDNHHESPYCKCTPLTKCPEEYCNHWLTTVDKSLDVGTHVEGKDHIDR